MDCCNKAIRNPKHFMNCVFRKGRSKYMIVEACLCLQYLCILALYQIVMLALVHKFKFLKNHVQAVKKKTENSKPGQFVMDKKLECLRKDFADYHFKSGSCDAGEVSASLMKKFQGKLIYSIYFKFLVWKVGDTPEKKEQASVSDSSGIAEKTKATSKVAAVGKEGKEGKVGTGAVERNDSEGEGLADHQNVGKQVLNRSTVAAVEGKKETSSGSQVVVEQEEAGTAVSAVIGKSSLWTELREDFASLSLLVVNLSVLCGNFKQKMIRYSSEGDGPAAAQNGVADSIASIGTDGAVVQGTVSARAGAGAEVPVDLDDEAVQSIMLQFDTTVAKVLASGDNKAPVLSTVKIEKPDKPFVDDDDTGAAKKTTRAGGKKKVGATQNSPARSNKKVKRT